MLVEDHATVLRVAKRMLENLGYEVTATRSASEAVRLGAMKNSNYSLLITDVVMPHMTGRELANALLTTRSQIRVLYMSGYPENGIVHHGLLEEGVNFLAKPITPVRLIASIEEALSTEPECSTKS